MDMGKSLFRWLRQFVVLLFIVCFLMSGLILNLIQLVFLPLYWINRKSFRIINSKIVYFHWALIPWAVETWAGYKIRIFSPVTSEEFKGYMNSEHALCLLNHRGDMDWMIGWCLLERSGMLSGAKAIMKDVAKYVPGIGWMFLLLEYPILKRNWEEDRERLATSCKNLADYPVNMILCLFAEGTRFTKKKHEVSVKFAKEKGLPILKHHLLPRPKGFTFLVKNMNKTIPAIYDVTFGYLEGEPSIVGLLDQVSCSCDIAIRRFDISEVPIDTDKSCSDWLNKIYKEKDDIVDYHKNHKTFPEPYHKMNFPKRPWPSFVMAIWMTLLAIPILLLVSYLFWIGAWYLLLGLLLTSLIVNQAFFMIVKLTEVRYGSDYGSDDRLKRDPYEKLNGSKKSM